MLHPMTTARLLLRRPHRDDAAAFFDLLCDAETCRMDGGYPPYTAMDEAFFRDFDSILATADDRLCIKERAGGRMIGLLHVMPCSMPAEAEIGVVIHRAARRRGYATEALSALFDQLRGCGTSRVIATCYAFNEASAAMLLRLGFSEGLPRPNETHPAYAQRSFSLTL